MENQGIIFTLLVILAVVVFFQLLRAYEGFANMYKNVAVSETTTLQQLIDNDKSVLDTFNSLRASFAAAPSKKLSQENIDFLNTLYISMGKLPNFSTNPVEHLDYLIRLTGDKSSLLTAIEKGEAKPTQTVKEFYGPSKGEALAPFLTTMNTFFRNFDKTFQMFSDLLGTTAEKPAIPSAVPETMPALQALLPSVSEGVSQNEIEQRLAKNIATQIKDELLVQRALTQPSAAPAAPAASDGLYQGMEYASSCPSKEPLNMNQYIRKDSIPCWGCTLPTNP